MAATYDAVVIGAGVMGASSALQLAAAGLKKVVVVEKAAGIGFGSTGKSSACIRQTYANPAVCLMAHEALQLFKNWGEFTGLRQTRAAFNNCGVLFLMGPADAAVPHVMEVHRQVGVASEQLDADEAQRRFPDLHLCATPLDLQADRHECGQGLQAIHELEGGFADPVGTTEDMLEAARALGVQLRLGARVVRLLQRGGRAAGVVLAAGGGEETLYAGAVVNCAGPWAMGINDEAGVGLPQRLAATRNQIVCKQFPEKLAGPLPMVADMVNGIYFRPDPTGGMIVLGSAREEDENEQVADPDHYQEGADAPFREQKLTLLHHRVATFRARGTITSYSGLYTVNLEDYHPIIDRSELEGFFPVCGFSGHGFKLSPVVGMIVAQKVLGQWGRGRTQVPLDFFDRGRAPLKSHWGGVMA